MRIGLLSDTHGILDARVFERFEGVDLIVHAGDLGRPGLVQELEAVAPLLLVRGNCDGFLGPEVPDFLVDWQVEGWGLFVIHDLGHPERVRSDVAARLVKSKPDLVVFGHSHRPYLQLRRQRLWVNPGSAARPRGGGPPSVATFSVDGDRAEVYVRSLDGEVLLEHACPWPPARALEEARAR